MSDALKGADRKDGRIAGGGKPTFRDYLKILHDRPPKFDAKQVDYRDTSVGEFDRRMDCQACVHFYKSTATGRTVCEIFRPDKDADVEYTWTCDFYTPDGVRFPLLPKEMK